MGPHIVILLSGVFLLMAVIYLLLNKKYSVSYSLIWIGVAFVVILTGIFPKILDWVCVLLNVDYQPTLAMMAAILFLIIFLFYLSSELAVAKNKISELSMQLSLLNNDIVELKEELNVDNC